MQCSNAHFSIRGTGGKGLTPLSVPGLPHPDVSPAGPRRSRIIAETVKRFLPADALWNLAMAINVYMTLFRNYNAQRLKTLEWRYHCMVCRLRGIVSPFATMSESCDESWINVTDPKVSISAMEFHSWLPSSTSL